MSSDQKTIGEMLIIVALLVGIFMPSLSKGEVKHISYPYSTANNLSQVYKVKTTLFIIVYLRMSKQSSSEGSF